MQKEISFMQTTAESRQKKSPTPKATIPVLEQGDHLTWEEFERRWDAMPDLKNAELIEGVVYMSSPVRVRKHGVPHTHMLGWVFVYTAGTPEIQAADNATFHISRKNAPQPDIALWINSDCGGKAFVNASDYLEGSPELLIEIASSTVSYDLHDKKRRYERSGVKEYIVWRVLDAAIDWFVLENGKYKVAPPDADGIIESRTFAGLRLNVAAMLAGDLARVLADLQMGINSPEHAAFVEQLQTKLQS